MLLSSFTFIGGEELMPQGNNILILLNSTKVAELLPRIWIMLDCIEVTAVFVTGYKQEKSNWEYLVYHSNDFYRQNTMVNHLIHDIKY